MTKEELIKNKIIMNYTNIDQSKHLLELGLSPNSADMFYKQKTSERTDMPYYDIIVGHSFAAEQNLFSFRNGFEIPCWSLSALLELMPKVMKGIPEKADYHFVLKKNVYDAWRCNYNHPWFGELYSFPAQKNPLDAAYNMVVWLLENNYIMKGE